MEVKSKYAGVSERNSVNLRRNKFSARYLEKINKEKDGKGNLEKFQRLSEIWLTSSTGTKKPQLYLVEKKKLT